MIMNNSNEAKNNGCNRIQTDVNQNYLKYGKYNLNNQRILMVLVKDRYMKDLTIVNVTDIRNTLNMN